MEAFVLQALAPHLFFYQRTKGIYPLSLDLRLCCLRILTILITHKVTPVVRSLAPRRKPKSKGYITYHLANPYANIAPMSYNSLSLKVDIIVIGGGIAGLWAINRLTQLGYQALLIEHQALGSGQTIKSQGIIHGGLKYALNGILGLDGAAIQDMPGRWQACLKGEGELDLRAVELLSPYQYLFSTRSLTAQLAQSFAQFTLQGKVDALNSADYPNFFQAAAIKGKILRLEEMVLNVPSVIKTLAKLSEPYLLKIDRLTENSWLRNQAQELEGLELQNGQQRLKLLADCILMTAGSGNAEMLQCFPSPTPRMQHRPLQMSVAKFSEPYEVFAHCMDGQSAPRLTITTHRTEAGETVWYLGGRLAEEGVQRSQSEQIKATELELKTLFPNMPFSNLSCSAFRVDRAEAWQHDGKKPALPTLYEMEKIIIAWPTKLAFAPLLADLIIDSLTKKNILPTHRAMDLTALQTWPKPLIAKPLWEE